MASAQRVSHEPAFILHRHDWSESSLILEVFTRHRGRTTIVAKGAKKHTSNFRPVLLALQPLHIHYTLAGGRNTPTSQAGDIHTLRGAEWAGGHTLPLGQSLLTGLYLNELLMRLLARDDPYAYLFDVYASLVQLLATPSTQAALPSALRGFELILLRELGLLPDLHPPAPSPADPASNANNANAPPRYLLSPEAGLRQCRAEDAYAHNALPARHWQALAQALSLDDAHSYRATVAACADCAHALKPQLRQLLQHHCGEPPLRTQQLMQDFLELSRL